MCVMSSSTTSPQIASETASASGSDSKKRNRLGYHRTAVACGHCRRRKIRCKSSADQTENRCQNCIRLKKECQFYPVEGNGSNTRVPRSEVTVEPSISERTASKDSLSPDLVPSASQESYDMSVVTDSVPNTAWEIATGLMASPTSGIEIEHKHEQPNWSVGPTQGHTQNPYHAQHNQSSSASASAYWFADNSTAMPYQQRQFNLDNAPAARSQDPQLQHSSQGLGVRHGPARRSFSSMPMPNMVQSPSPYQHFNVTFPENQRSMTMPAMQNQSTISSADIDMQMSPQLVSAQGQYAYSSAFLPQSTDNAQWYPLPNSQQAFAQHYLPSQRDPTPHYQDHLS